MKGKKSQIHMLETVAVLLVFFVLVLIGLIFYVNVLRGNIAEQKEESIQLVAIEIAQRVSSLPELQCSEDNIVSPNCIDIIKLDAAPDIIQGSEIHYFDKLSFSTVTVESIYPTENQWLLYDRPLDDFTNKIATNIPISLFDPIDNKNSFGIMKVEMYIR